jgi:glycosyltransferase involved in cell wall biosynthesis
VTWGAADVTAVVTCFESGEFLRMALDSIRSQGPIRIVLVDDGSTNCSCRDIAGNYEHLFRIDRDNGGQAAALNSGVAEVRTELIAFLDDDDEWLPGKVQRQVDLMVGTGADAVVGGVRNVQQRDGTLIADSLFPATRLLGAVTAQTQLVRKVGPFPESIRHHAIVEWWSRADREGQLFVNDDEPVLLRRIHGRNSGVIHRDAARRDLLHILRDHAARRSGG